MLKGIYFYILIICLFLNVLFICIYIYKLIIN